MTTEIIITIVAVAIVGLLLDSTLLRIRRRKLLKLYVQTTLENSILEKQLDTSSFGPSESEGFIKFLSDSRQWAFDYIEDVQQAIVELETALATSDQKLITEAYQKLKTFLPDNDKNN